MKTGTIKAKHFKSAPFRIDPSFHLSEGIKVRSMLENVPYGLTTVKEASDDVFIGNIFSRVFVKDENHGVPYLAASDTVLANLDTGRFLSFKQASELSYLILQKDWILATCSGTLGNVSYTNSEFEGKIATHDLIRIVPNDKKVLRGCLFAFLASKYGYYQLTESMFGGVVKHINADHAASIKVPCFPMDLQNRIDKLVKESAALKEESAYSLKHAHKIIQDYLKTPAKSVSNHVSIKRITVSHNHRFEANYYVSDNRWLYDYLLDNFNCARLKDCTSSIFRPGIFKREYVKNGVPFLGGADVMLSVPTSDKKLSFKQVARMPDLLVKKGWILATCGGTIGRVVYTDEQICKCAISQHVMRIVPVDVKKSNLLFAYLSSEIGYKLITLFAFGSVIPQVEPQHLQMIPIPTFPANVESELLGLITTYSESYEKAKEKELEAISLVETEIEKWNN